MKRIIIFFIAPMLLLAACSKDWVDNKPNGLPTTAYFWQTEGDVAKAVAAMYAPMQNESTWGRDIFYQMNASDDFVTGRVKANADNMKNFVCTGNEGYLSSAYSDLYWMLNKANQVIQYIDNATVSEEVKTQAKGEAYFVRGFAHFWIASTWGREDQGVPFDMPENSEYENRIPPQLASVKDNYAQIVSDFQKAANLLPYFESYSSANYGHAHKAAAWGYLVKTLAYWAEYEPTKWEDVPAYCDSIKVQGKRALFTVSGDPNASYRGVFKHTNNWSSEYIWSVNSGTSGGWEFPGVVLENKGWGLFNGWGYFQPTLELYNEYEANDPRREATILKFNDEFGFFGVTRNYFSTNSLTGFQLAKYMDPYSYGTDGTASSDPYIYQNGDNPTTALNGPLMRYAEILLFKAEAYLMMNKPDLAAGPLNEVRERVGLSEISSPTLADLKHERRCELAGEFTDRFKDLKRWHDYDNIKAELHGQIHSSKSDPTSDFTVGIVWASRNFNESKDIAWPYPPTEIANSNGVYKQNSGW
jgi:starch-binding outer membrane protein, SusD/RagB family